LNFLLGFPTATMIMFVEAKQVGISTFLRKPVKEVQLKTILQVVLGS